MQKVTPFLWFDGRAEEAVQFYTSIFNNAQHGDIRHYSAGGPAPEGSVMSGSFTIGGVEFIAFNGGPMFKFTPAISLFVNCETQEEVDYYWNALLQDGGVPNRCGWLNDKFGLSWQVVPSILGQLLQSPDREKAQRTMQAMMQMIKLDVAALKAAAEG